MKEQQILEAIETSISNTQTTLSAQDTIYLCNFRVSVDGDWLCLRQLEDVEVPIKRNNIETLQSPEYVPFFGNEKDSDLLNSAFSSSAFNFVICSSRP